MKCYTCINGVWVTMDVTAGRRQDLESGKTMKIVYQNLKDALHS